MKIRKKMGFFTGVAALIFFLLLLSEKSYSNLEEHFPLLNLLVSSPVFQRESVRLSTNEEVYLFLEKRKSIRITINLSIPRQTMWKISG